MSKRAPTLEDVARVAGGSRATVFADQFFGRVAGGVLHFLRTQGIHPVLMLAETDRERAEVVDFLRRGNADGALLVFTHPEDPLPRLLTEAGLAAVAFARPARPIPIS